MLVGIVTRRPLVLQLYKTDPGKEDYAQFLHSGDKKFTDFCKSFSSAVLNGIVINSTNAMISLLENNMKVISAVLLSCCACRCNAPFQVL